MDRKMSLSPQIPPHGQRNDSLGGRLLSSRGLMFVCSYDAASAVQLVGGDVTDKCAVVMVTGLRRRLPAALRRLVGK